MRIKSAEFVTSAVKVSDYPAGGLPEVALAGRSNVGKSSLLNRLVNRRKLARTSNTPGRTRLLNFFKVNDNFYLVDLPGYGYARASSEERDRWKVMVEAYFSSTGNLKGIILLVDSRHPPSVQDLQMFNWIKHHGIPSVVVATKADKLSRSKLIGSLKVIRSTLSLTEEDKLLSFSSETGQGRDELLGIIESWTV